MYLSLIYLSLALLAGFGNAAALVGEKHTVHRSFMLRFHHYVKFVAASIPSACPNPPNGAEVIAYINDEVTSTQARIFRDHKTKEIIFAAPGTAGSIDYQTDANYTQVPYNSPGIVGCDKCAVHGGFLDAWNSIATRTHEIIKAAHHKHEGYKIVIAGHSLGGAIANLAWASLKREGLPIHAAYTYGQPRIGNHAFANHIDKLSGASHHSSGNFFRITHAADPVPNEPPMDGGYWRHSKTEYWEAGEEVQNKETTWRCYGQENPSCSLSQQGAPNGADHMQYSNVDLYDAEKYCA